MAETGFLLIADISGYTEFVKLHNLAKNRFLARLWQRASSLMQQQ